MTHEEKDSVAILGHGVDAVETLRIERMLLDDSDAFSGWFTLTELENLTESPDQPRTIAGRIAAKEAVAKAIGAGFSQAVSWQDIEITKDTRGAPQVTLSDGARKVAGEVGITRILLSISHTNSLAIASAISVSE